MRRQWRQIKGGFVCMLPLVLCALIFCHKSCTTAGTGAHKATYCMIKASLVLAMGLVCLLAVQHAHAQCRKKNNQMKPGQTWIVQVDQQPRLRKCKREFRCDEGQILFPEQSVQRVCSRGSLLLEYSDVSLEICDTATASQAFVIDQTLLPINEKLSVVFEPHQEDAAFGLPPGSNIFRQFFEAYAVKCIIESPLSVDSEGEIIYIQ